MALNAAPEGALDATGRARTGTYQGSLARVNLKAGGSLSRLARFVRHKRWHYTLITTPEVVALAAVVDLGYTANAFACAVDLQSRKVLADESFLGPPGPLVRVGDLPADGLDASFKTLGARISAAREKGDGRYRVEAEIAGLRSRTRSPFRLVADVLADGAPEPLTVIAPVDGEGVNVTQKASAMLVEGSLEVAGRRFSLDGGVAGMDYTQGLLARRTAWRWAFAQGRLANGAPVGLNLVEGFNESASEANENALWVDGQVIPLARARFSFDRADYTRPWKVETLDGSVRVSFTPLHVHQELRDYKLVRSRFVQVVGLFEGEFRRDGSTVRLESVPGVTEDQDVLW